MRLHVTSDPIDSSLFLCNSWAHYCLLASHQWVLPLPGSPRDQYHILYDNGTRTLLNGSEGFGHSFKVQAQIKVLMVCRSWQLGLMSLLQSWQLHCNWTLWNVHNHDEQPGGHFFAHCYQGLHLHLGTVLHSAMKTKARKFVFWQPLLVDTNLSRSLQRAIDTDREKGSDDCS